MKYQIAYQFDDGKDFYWITDDFFHSSITGAYRQIIMQACKRRLCGYQIVELSDQSDTIPVVVDHREYVKEHVL